MVPPELLPKSLLYEIDPDPEGGTIGLTITVTDREGNKQTATVVLDLESALAALAPMVGPMLEHLEPHVVVVPDDVAQLDP